MRPLDVSIEKVKQKIRENVWVGIVMQKYEVEKVTLFISISNLKTITYIDKQNLINFFIKQKCQLFYFQLTINCDHSLILCLCLFLTRISIGGWIQIIRKQSFRIKLPQIQSLYPQQQYMNAYTLFFSLDNDISQDQVTNKLIERLIINQEQQFKIKFRQLKKLIYESQPVQMQTTIRSNNMINATQTPAWSSIHSRQLQDNNWKQQYEVNKIKRINEKNILQRLNRVKEKAIDEKEIMKKMMLARGTPDKSDAVSGYYRLGEQNEKKREQRSNWPYRNVEKENISLSHSRNKQYSPYGKSRNLQKSNAQTNQNISRLTKPTYSFSSKHSNNQQICSKSPFSHNKEVKNLNLSKKTCRSPLSQISIHEQLYMDSKKMEVRKATEQIIQNEYFKKKCTFRPQIGEVSQFLALQRREKLRDKEQWEREFQGFIEEDNSQKKSYKNQKNRSHKKDSYDIQHRKQQQDQIQSQQHYRILKHFYQYLIQSSQKLTQSCLTQSILLQLPTPCLTLLEPILKSFYQNKNKSSTWLQFLSEFNLTVKKRKAFFGIVEKWFYMRFGIKFNQDQEANLNTYHHTKSRCKEFNYDDTKDEMTKIFNVAKQDFTQRKTNCHTNNSKIIRKNI